MASPGTPSPRQRLSLLEELERLAEPDGRYDWFRTGMTVELTRQQLAEFKEVREPRSRTPARSGVTARVNVCARQTFALFDKDGSGSIDSSELGMLMNALGYRVNDLEAAALVRKVDAGEFTRS